MSNIFSKFIDDGKAKIDSLQKRLSDTRDILIQLNDALRPSNVELLISPTQNHRGTGFKVDITTNRSNLIKKFLTITVPSSEKEMYYLEMYNDVTPITGKESLISSLGKIVSSVQFWQDIEELKKMESLPDIPF